MAESLAIAIAQIDPTVGDIEGNVAAITRAREEAARQHADLVVFTELVVSGYPPEDLVCQPFFQDRVEAAVRRLAEQTNDGGPALILGTPWREGGAVYNATVVLDGGEIAAVRYKHELPNYGVFDEKRVFSAGPLPGPVNIRGVRLGVMICEDMWADDVTECLEESGAEILVVLNGSPFETDKSDTRLNLAVARVTESGLPMIYANQVGGQDELVFDGASFILGAKRELALQLPSWREHVGMSHWRRTADGWACDKGPIAPASNGLEAIYQALMLGLRGYVHKNGFPGVIIGLSGGIDSTLSAVVAADALGAEQVRCIMMPSPYTSKASLEDAAETARLLGAGHETISIAPAMEAFEEMLRPAFDALPPDVTEENIQARVRGLTLMALSNKFGHLVLSTGNKSEMSVGYATLYGDMCGGYSVMKDVYKTTVYKLAGWRNQRRPEGARGPDGRVVPERVLTKAPSAELRPDQTDQDTLPPYDTLDDILQCLVEAEMGIDDIAARGHDRTLVQRVWRMVDQAEYKRRQAPPGVKITRRAFGRDRRYPITNAFRNIL